MLLVVFFVVILLVVVLLLQKQNSSQYTFSFLIAGGFCLCSDFGYGAGSGYAVGIINHRFFLPARPSP